MLGFGMYDRKMRCSNKKSQINVQDGCMVITWAKREKVEGDSSYWKVGRHPHPINRRLPALVPCLKVTGGRSMGWADKIDS